MKISIICVGSIKEKFYTDACLEYQKRLSRFHNIEVIEVNEYKLDKSSSNKDIEKAKDIESQRLLEKCKGYTILLDLTGKNYDSVEFSDKIQSLANTTSHISFIIGGSNGVSQTLKQSVKEKICFSKMTFPHQLMRVILLEQVYRATTISNNITYHK